MCDNAQQLSQCLWWHGGVAEPGGASALHCTCRLRHPLRGTALPAAPASAWPARPRRFPCLITHLLPAIGYPLSTATISGRPRARPGPGPAACPKRGSAGLARSTTRARESQGPGRHAPSWRSRYGSRRRKATRSCAKRAATTSVLHLAALPPGRGGCWVSRRLPGAACSTGAPLCTPRLLCQIVSGHVSRSGDTRHGVATIFSASGDARCDATGLGRGRACQGARVACGT